MVGYVRPSGKRSDRSSLLALLARHRQLIVLAGNWARPFSAILKVVIGYKKCFLIALEEERMHRLLKSG